jgi:hypothetical protein
MDKKIKCINEGPYKITLDKEYNLVKTEGNYYFLQNDSLKLVRYSKDFFEEVQNNITLEEESNVVISLTEAQVIASISEDGSAFTDNDGEFVELELCFLSASESTISCGIIEFQGINDLISSIEEEVPTVDSDRIELKRSIFKKVIKYSVSQQKCAIALFSTNVDFDEDILPALDEISDIVSQTIINPNSENNIKLWMMYK